MRRSTVWSLGGVLAGTVLLGTGGTMATFSDTQSISVVVGAAADLDGSAPAPTAALAVRAVTPPGNGTGPGRALTFAVDASATGATAGLQWTAVDGPGNRACAGGGDALTVSVAGPWLPAVPPVSLCDLLDAEHPVVLVEVEPGAPLDGALLEVRFTGRNGQGLPPRGWNGTFRFTLVPGGGAPAATVDVPVGTNGPR
ncbi:hypothetical protein JKP75_11590 [Blastococcus sp. TML/M2B]|uniref:hypothetical protein n=1 Tax=unclassified Blastococcus TaxID=2619396 RepID=UPI00190CBF1C|nr:MULTISPECIES: hypothetical protein [unclassified Blastococcus]MBN1093137.1 hypothetical protein [Blastococcus sp. TML/M2B]MBN1096743.1 hypothetical protein [Blastococcus sp. TML/C7B]